MSSSLFNMSLGALRAVQTSLETTSHNIANANTPGYSRQVADFGTTTPQMMGGNYIGTGVQVTGVGRKIDEAVLGSLRNATSQHSMLEVFSSFNRSIDGLLTDESAGLSPAMIQFFDGLQELVDNPASISSRQVMLSKTESLTSRFNFLFDRFEDIRQDFNRQLGFEVNEANELGATIADLNQQILEAEARPGANANDLRDKRDTAITQLSEKMNIQTLEQDNGMVNVMVGSGQPLVMGAIKNDLRVTNNPYDYSRKDISIVTRTSTVDISGQISAGSIGGLVNFREQVLDIAQNEIGRLAVVLGTEYNEIHQQGMDMEGQMGEPFFSITQPSVYAQTQGGSTLSYSSGGGAVEITNGKDLTASNYEIYYNGNQYTLTRLSDNQVVGTSLDGNFAEVDGLTFTASGVGVAGDKFLIRPVEYGARDISVLVSDPKSIAAAGPLRANTPGENQGSVEITISDIGDPDNLTFNDYQIQFVDDGAGGLAYFVSNEGNQVFPSPPLLVAGASTNTGDGVITLTDEGDQSNADYFTSLTIVFEDPVDPADPLIYRVLDATTGLELGSGDYVDGNDLFPTANGAFEPGYQLVIADGATPFVAGDSFSVERNLQPYTSGDEIAIPNDGFSITMTGVPAIGDTFSIERNSGGVGDNQNALRLLALETTRMVDGSQTTLQESYSGMVSNVGTITQRIDVNLGAQYALLQNSIQNREMVSGVNLDEEAANLLRFQQAYQASAQMIKIASSLFDSILSVVG